MNSHVIALPMTNLVGGARDVSKVCWSRVACEHLQWKNLEKFKWWGALVVFCKCFFDVWQMLSELIRLRSSSHHILSPPNDYRLPSIWIIQSLPFANFSKFHLELFLLFLRRFDWITWPICIVYSINQKWKCKLCHPFFLSYSCLSSPRPRSSRIHLEKYICKTVICSPLIDIQKFQQRTKTANFNRIQIQFQFRSKVRIWRNGDETETRKRKVGIENHFLCSQRRHTARRMERRNAQATANTFIWYLNYHSNFLSKQMDSIVINYWQYVIFHLGTEGKKLFRSSEATHRTIWTVMLCVESTHQVPIWTEVAHTFLIRFRRSWIEIL